MVTLTRPPCDEGVIRGLVRPDRTAACPPDVRRWTLVATILASSMVFIDGSVVNVALPTLQREFGASGADALWVVEAYALFLAALILVGGSLGDHLGRRRIFLLGTALFAATSIWCGLAPNIGTLISARAAQGIAGALLTPASLAIISATFTEPGERGRAIGTWSGFTSITAAGGPVLGGWLVETVSWRWVFFINLPLAAVVFFVASRFVAESRDPDAGRLDFVGAALVTVGLGGLVFGLIEAPVEGWGNPLVLVALAVGVAGLAGFLFTEARVRAPMMPLGLFASRTFSGTNLLTLLLYGAFGGALYYLPFNLIQVHGYSSTAAGAAFVPAILIIFGLSRWTGGLIGRFGARLPLVVGPLTVAGGLLLMTLPGTGGSYWTTFFPAVIVLGVGMAITVPPLTTAVMGAVSDRQSGIASGVNNAVSRTAQLLAIAVFGIVVAGVFRGQLADRLDGVPNLPTATRAAIVAQEEDLAAAEVPAGTDPAVATAAREAIDGSFVASFRVAMVIGAVMAALSALAAWALIGGRAAAPAPVPATTSAVAD